MKNRTVIDIFHAQVSKLGDRPALRRKVGRGSERHWETLSWRDYGSLVERAARGFKSLGHQPGQPICILSFNRVEWMVGDLAAMAAGGAPCGIYQSSSAEQVEYVLAHSGAPIVLVENAAQLAKVREAKARCPGLRWVVSMDELAGPREDWLISFAELLQRGEVVAPSLYRQWVDALDPRGLATLVYTSGTTGPPKAVMLSHANILWTVEKKLEVLGSHLTGASALSYLPLAHVAEQMFAIHDAVAHGVTIWFAESLDPATLKANLLEARPAVFFSVPRIWDKFKAGIEAKLAASPKRRQAIFRKAREVGLAHMLARLEGKPVGLGLWLRHAFFDRLVFRRLKRALGLDRAQHLISGGAPLNPEVHRFFLSVGMEIREGYGQSEDCGPSATNREGAHRPGTVGTPLPGAELRLGPDGEVLVRGPHVFMGYYKDPEATAAALDAEGWLHSGDVGELDADGYLRITDRLKDLIVTSGGKKAAPQNLEARLKLISPVSEAMVVGEGRNYLAAILTLEPVKAAEWAKERGLPAEVAELSRHPALREHLRREIDAQNETLARFETIKRFEILDHDFTVENGALTPTLKLRRKVLVERHARLIESLYSAGGATGT
jgi:long-chain acyl-CoA synthetase